MLNKTQIDEIVSLNKQELKLLDYSDSECDTMTKLMIIILIQLTSIGLDGNFIYHKNTVQTFRSLANIIELITEKQNEQSNNS